MKQQIKLLYLLLPLLILNTWKGQAQWTKQDSIWLKNVLEGKDSLRLNPEFMKEMQEGLFLNPKQPAGEQQTAPRELPITKDFSEYMPYSDNPTPQSATPKRILAPYVAARSNITHLQVIARRVQAKTRTWELGGGCLFRRWTNDEPKRIHSQEKR